MKILGLDPANQCGWAFDDGFGVTFGVWSLKDKTDQHAGRRLERFRRRLFTFRREHGFEVIGFEDASFGSNNAHTAASHNELCGVIKMVAAELEVPVFDYKPNHLKKWLTGSGKASKQDMIAAVERRFQIKTDNDNIADAIAVMARTKHEFTEKSI